MNTTELNAWTMFATAALQGILSNPAGIHEKEHEVVELAAMFADKMMIERTTRTGGRSC